VSPFGIAHGTARFGDVVALDDVSLSVEPGDVVAVVGGDGAGKSTLLRSVVGEVRLASGEVLAPDPRSIGYLPATAGSWPALTVAENATFAAGAYGLAGAERDARRDALLARAGLANAADRLASQLSGGMRRKLGFVMAVQHAPALLVLDEPSTGVDPVSRIDLWRLISEEAARGAAVIMSTTYLDEAERAARLLVLDGGVELAGGMPPDVIGSLDGVVTDGATPIRPAWAWRRGRRFRELWPSGTQVPADARQIAPDLEDAVVGLSLARVNGAAA
jgi:ABC-2 type transport system ATP-binding protein